MAMTLLPLGSLPEEESYETYNCEASYYTDHNSHDQANIRLASRVGDRPSRPCRLIGTARARIRVSRAS